MAAITAELALEVGKFQASLKQAQGMLAGFKQHAQRQGEGLGGSLFQGIAAVFGGEMLASLVKESIGSAFDLVKGAAEGLKGAFDLGGQLVDAAARLDTMPSKILVLQAAFKSAGMQAEDVTTGIAKMQKNLAEAALNGGDGAALLQGLQLDPKALTGMDSIDAFQKIGAQIAQIENPTLRAQAAMQIFGRSGAQMLALFRDPEAMKQAADMIGSQAQILDEHAADFDHISDVLGGAFHKLQGFFVGLGAALVDYLSPVADWFNQLDLAKYGRQLGDAIVGAFQWAKAIWETFDWSTAGTVLLAGLSLAFKTGVNVLWAGLWGTVRAFGQYLTEAFKTGVMIFGIVTTADFWKGVGNALIGIAVLFTAKMLDGIAEILRQAAKIPGLGKLKGAANYVQGEADYRKQYAQQAFDAAGKALSDPIDQATVQLADSAAQIADAFKQGYNDTGNVFDTSKETDVLGGYLEKIRAQMEKNIASDEANKKKHENFATPDAIEGISPAGKSGVGALAGAVGLIMGRSANELVVDEARKTNQYLAAHSDALKQIAENTRPDRGADSTPAEVVNPSWQFQ